jgi:hypothetical protein
LKIASSTTNRPECSHSNSFASNEISRLLPRHLQPDNHLRFLRVSHLVRGPTYLVKPPDSRRLGQRQFSKAKYQLLAIVGSTTWRLGDEPMTDPAINPPSISATIRGKAQASNTWSFTDAGIPSPSRSRYLGCQDICSCI